MKKMFLFAVAALVATAVAAPFKVVGFYPYWSQYSQFFPKDVRYQFVTHIHYASLAPAEDGSLAFADENDAPAKQGTRIGEFAGQFQKKRHAGGIAIGAVVDAVQLFPIQHIGIHADGSGLF